ncbi:EF-hand domain-containing protein [Tropicibacter sp. R15_0]|uniref:EF-hand domain-containing protein n=1 Tax=Tropicibacter sp. R15_0 TaxID=2821101 RepID=UPI001ADC77D5|nr:EF-hand domain-containing protein [Tropicibacter sp. R15_0]MBO9468301.1 EF-hand domain-containing protein [Tropicibacter sp. R15_0]
MKKATLLGGVLILALGGASLASAAGMQHGKGPGGMKGGPNAEMLFEQLDANGDGQITKEEVENAPKLRFEAADTDGDGFLSDAELKAAAEKRDAARAARRDDRIAKMIERLDADKDGKLSMEEMEARGEGRKGKGKGDRALRLFDRADANNDGVLTMEEVETAMANMGKRKGFGKRHGHGRGHY